MFLYLAFTMQLQFNLLTKSCFVYFSESTWTPYGTSHVLVCDFNAQRTLNIALDFICYHCIVLLCWWANTHSEFLQGREHFTTSTSRTVPGPGGHTENWTDKWIISGHWTLPQRVFWRQVIRNLVKFVTESLVVHRMKRLINMEVSSRLHLHPQNTAITPWEEKWLQTSLWSPDRRKTMLSIS